MKRAIVIGAGAAGLVTARRLLDAGIEPIVVERSEHIGGVWNYDEEPRGGSYAYRSLRTNTSRHTMAFSDQPFEAGLPDFPSRADALAYLVRFSETGRLTRYVRTHAEVTEVRPLDGRWEVVLRTGGPDERCETDGIVVATGIQSVPRPPRPASDRFRGRQLHSSAYRGPEIFEGARVLVVGLGSSGVDIATEATRAARRVVVSSPNGAWLLPRHIAGRPWDHHLTRISAALPERARLGAFEALVRLEYRRLGVDPRRSGLAVPPFDPLRWRFTPGCDLLDARERVVAFRPDIAEVLEDRVRFIDGSEERVDVIVWSTGYETLFPFLRDVVEPHADLGLYRHVFPTRADGLAFVGMCVVGGPAWPMLELQAAWVAAVFSGAQPLPDAASMRAAILARRAALRGRDPLRVDYVPYLSAIAREAGRHARMTPGPGLLGYLAGPVTASQFT